jgi:hypothetical protein
MRPHPTGRTPTLGLADFTAMDCWPDIMYRKNLNLDFIYLGEVRTSFSSGRSGLHLPRGGLTSFTLGRSGLHLPRGGLDFIYIGKVCTSFTYGSSWLHLPLGALDLMYLGEVPKSAPKAPPKCRTRVRTSRKMAGSIGRISPYNSWQHRLPVNRSTVGIKPKVRSQPNIRLK